MSDSWNQGQQGPYGSQPPTPPPGWGAPASQQGGPINYIQPENNKNNGDGLATASMVCGIVGLVLFWLCGLGAVIGIVAVVLGCVALSTLKKRVGASNSGRAWAGIITGAIAILLGVITPLAITMLGDNINDNINEEFNNIYSSLEQ